MSCLETANFITSKIMMLQFLKNTIEKETDSRENFSFFWTKKVLRNFCSDFKDFLISTFLSFQRSRKHVRSEKVKGEKLFLHFGFPWHIGRIWDRYTQEYFSNREKTFFPKSNRFGNNFLFVH